MTVDAAGLCLKSGNAALLRGSSSAASTNEVLVAVMWELSPAPRCRPTRCSWCRESRSSAEHLMTARIGRRDHPAGGAGLISSVVNNSTVPVIETGVGNYHVYTWIVTSTSTRPWMCWVNSKTQRVSVCNAAETLLVHADVADEFLPPALKALADKGVTVHGDDRMAGYAQAAGIDFVPATDVDWADEYYSLDIAAAIVDDLPVPSAIFDAGAAGTSEAILSTSAPARIRARRPWIPPPSWSTPPPDSPTAGSSASAPR